MSDLDYDVNDGAAAKPEPRGSPDQTGKGNGGAAAQPEPYGSPDRRE